MELLSVLAVLAALALLVLVGWLLRRILTRKSKGGIPDRAGVALLEMQSILEPGKKHIVQAKRQEKKQDDQTGGPDDPEYFR